MSASNVLAESIQESSSAIIQLQASSTELSSNAVILGDRADDSSSSLEQMTMSNHQVISKTELLDHAVLNASTKIEGLASAMAQVEESATQSADSSMRVVEFSDRGREAVQQTIDGIEEIQSNATAASNVIEALGERGREIGAIIDVINGVADETNLLALNAAIIAAQAGEQGKAFSVVAVQIKELADRVLTSTKEVTSLIESLQDGTIDAVTVMRAGEASVLAGVKVAAEAGASLHEIDTAARHSGDRASQIVDAMREQASSTRAIKELMADVLVHVGEIRHTGKDQTGCSESNLQDALVVGEVAKELRRAAEEQSLGTGRIRGNLDEVRDSIQTINDALQEQSVANKNILDSTESIQERTVSNERSAVTMRNVVDRLNEQARSLREGLQRFKF
jgi:methyl-accepting chemotaxis protein